MAYPLQDEIVNAWETWWKGKAKKPLCYMIFPEGDLGSLKSLRKDWMDEKASGSWTMWEYEMLLGQGIILSSKRQDKRYIDEAIDFIEGNLMLTDSHAAGYRFYLPGLGPAFLASFFTGAARYVTPTIWTEAPKSLPFEEIFELLSGPIHPYGELAFQAVQKCADRLGGRCVIAMPDMGSSMDILSSLRHNNTLLMDLYDNPDEIDKALSLIEGAAEKLRARFSSIIDPVNGGLYAETMRYLSASPTHIPYCDFSAMIGPDMFNSHVLPSLKRECLPFPDRAVFHLDGPQMIAHLPAILSVPQIRAIQWVPGAGNPGTLNEKWYSVYRQIIDSGRLVCMAGVPADVSQLKNFFSQFPAEHFFLPFTLKGRSHAEDLLNEMGW
jgi:hypothetical protein